MLLGYIVALSPKSSSTDVQRHVSAGVCFRPWCPGKSDVNTHPNSAVIAIGGWIYVIAGDFFIVIALVT